MQARPTVLNGTLQLETLEDVDAALHEMAWLTSFQHSIEAKDQVRIETIKAETNARLVVDVDGKTLTVKERWDALQAALFAWCEDNLKANLPPNKKSLPLAHGAIKTRGLPAAVDVLNGKSAADVALELARRGELLSKVDELLAVEIDGIPLSKLIGVEFVLAKEAIKDVWERSPEQREFLQSLSISVSQGRTQITLAPAAVKVATHE